MGKSNHNRDDFKKIKTLTKSKKVKRKKLKNQFQKNKNISEIEEFFRDEDE